MTIIPFQISATEYSVFIALDDGNIERIKGHDPAQFDLRKITGVLGSEFEKLRLRMVLIGWVTLEDVKVVAEMLRTGAEVRTVLTFLSRGFAFRPSEGDHDGDYVSLLGEARD